MKALNVLCMAIFFAGSTSSVSAQDYAKGMAAMNSGDNLTALEELLPFAERGDVRAQTYVAFIYGDEVFGNDYAEGNKWYRLAANQGFSVAQYALAGNYDIGLGFVEDDFRAYMWYRIAALNGADYAVENVNILSSKMTPEEIASAEAMAQECMNSGYENCGE